ncbi:Class I SAM-dependent methyltransferase [Pararobbsia alpina]|uniref:class I SAM-dependent methyltransferase n=1 Tax=Pararobbsia alpina TaxID=621374 RepID=UPI0039A5657A
MSELFRSDAQLIDANRQFYDALWSSASLVDPERFNTWPIVESLLGSAPDRLEVAPGLRPRLPLDGSKFVDLSEPAIRALTRRGADAVEGQIAALPFEDGQFDLVCALDIVEHVDDDDSALRELVRVARPDATVLMSVPLHPSRWTSFDDYVGHRRRYEPAQLLTLLATHGLTIERSAVYGMQPESSRLLDFGVWGLTHHPRFANWLYNRVLMPIGMYFQKPLILVDGLLDTTHVDEVLLICRRRIEPAASAA